MRDPRLAGHGSLEQQSVFMQELSELIGQEDNARKWTLVHKALRCIFTPSMDLEKDKIPLVKNLKFALGDECKNSWGAFPWIEFEVRLNHAVNIIDPFNMASHGAPHWVADALRKFIVSQISKPEDDCYRIMYYMSRFQGLSPLQLANACGDQDGQDGFSFTLQTVLVLTYHWVQSAVSDQEKSKRLQDIMEALLLIYHVHLNPEEKRRIIHILDLKYKECSENWEIFFPFLHQTSLLCSHINSTKVLNAKTPIYDEMDSFYRLLETLLATNDNISEVVKILYCQNCESPYSAWDRVEQIKDLDEILKDEQRSNPGSFFEKHFGTGLHPFGYFFGVPKIVNRYQGKFRKPHWRFHAFYKHLLSPNQELSRMQTFMRQSHSRMVKRARRG